MATFRTCQCQDGVKVLTVMNEDERALKDALENFNTQKSTSTRILSSVLSKHFEKYQLKPKFKL